VTGPPVWLHTVDDDIFEPLGTSSSLPLPEDMVLCEDSSTRDIGDWGELLVKNYLEAVLVSFLACRCTSEILLGKVPRPHFGVPHTGVRGTKASPN